VTKARHVDKAVVVAVVVAVIAAAVIAAAVIAAAAIAVLLQAAVLRVKSMKKASCHRGDDVWPSQLENKRLLIAKQATHQRVIALLRSVDARLIRSVAL
jgi:hypothetical protein